MRNINTNKLLSTDISGLDESVSSIADSTAKELHRALCDTRQGWKDRRQNKTERFLECWATYFGSPEAEDWKRYAVLHKSVGDVAKDWRHRIDNGKGYEIVETVVAYLMGATFPNSDWFELIPSAPINDPQYLQYIKIMKSFLAKKLGEAKFESAFERYLRQLVVLGTSVISLPWRLETKKQKKNVPIRTSNGYDMKVSTVDRVIRNSPDIVVEDMLDFFLDPDASDPNCASFVRRMLKTKGEVIRLVNDDVYDLATVEEIKKCRATEKNGKTEERSTYNSFTGDNYYDFHPADKIEVFEFWGDIELSKVSLQDVVVTFTENTILRCETNPYWCGRPFVIGNYTPVVQSPYGLGALEPVLGKIHTANIISNNRLDAISIITNPMYEVVNDGVVDPADVETYPGKIYPVAATGNISPVAHDRGFAGVSINDEQLLETKIDKSAGTGSFIGSGPGRSGERVTATEVQAVKDAGGNRLSSIHSHLEENSTVPILEKTYGMAQQFVVEPEMVRINGTKANEYFYALVGPEQLELDFEIRALGSGHVADKEFERREMSDWITTISANEQMMAVVNWEAVAQEVTRKFIKNDPERFLKTPEQQQQEQQTAAAEQAAMAAPQGQQPGSPAEAAAMDAQAQQLDQQQALVDGAQDIGGNEMAMAAQGEIQAGGGPMMQALFGQG